ncbi:MAG: hypothetical protein LPK00_09460 [Bacillaceae bacterium]|nr:hypothetical protein [Bacillaceae bacterium]
MDEMLKQILGEFQKVNNRLDGLENAQQELKKDFQNGQQELKDEFQNSQLELKQELKNDFQSSQLELKQELKNDFQNSQLELKQELKKDVLSIKDNLIRGLGPYFENIEKHIDAKTDEIKGALEDQQIVIDTLSVRSIKQESEIKELKRMLTNQ